ncbi:MAG: hypothetical protein Q9M19_04765 [Mariprofundaceae bacterium]|nr:hypothetical protein [Mariprofundaceae bacterium]
MDLTLLNMAFDGLMIMAILALWVMWYQQGAQRKKVEKMLAQASTELQQATDLLEQVLVHFPNLQDHDVLRKTEEVQDVVQISPSPQQEKRVRTQPTYAQAKPNEAAGTASVRTKAGPVSDQVPEKHSSSSQSAHIMRLKREGLNADSIANQLAIPIAQVRLLLLLQAPKV